MITIYKTTRCAYCKAVCKLFDMKNVKYELVDVEENPKLRQEVIEKSGAMTVPVVVLNDWEDFTVGFNPGKLLEIARKEG